MTIREARVLERTTNSSVLFPEVPEEYTLKFSSKGEYACGVLLERYIPDFDLIPGATFQVSIDRGRKCDFRIQDTFLEYHPITFHYDFDDKQALRRFNTALKSVTDEHVRREIRHSIKAELGEKYFLARNNIIRSVYGDSVDLVVVFDAQTLYEMIIKRYGRQYPTPIQFEAEFEELKDSV